MKVKQKIMLDVGAGNNVQPGFVGLDKRPLPGVQIVHDVETFPWPLEDESCSVVLMSHLIEHIQPAKHVALMDEVWRIIEDNGLLIISTPYPNSHGWHQDPTHCASWNESTPHYFVPGNELYEVYRPKPWKIDNLGFDIQTNLEVAFRKVGNGKGQASDGGNAEESPNKPQAD
jgi:SAM-dependent methyltransferase